MKRNVARPGWHEPYVHINGNCRLVGVVVADYALMEFPPGMIEFATEHRASDLNGGLAYASRVVPYSRELTHTQLHRVPADLQQRVLLFDIWVSNEDRYLTDQGGNVNLLWAPDNELVVIDHNLAFDPLVGIGDFTKHVFRDQLPALRDLEVRARHEEALDTALAEWDTITGLLPYEWIYYDPDDDAAAVKPTLEERRAWLARLREPEFWRDL